MGTDRRAARARAATHSSACRRRTDRFRRCAAWRTRRSDRARTAVLALAGLAMGRHADVDEGNSHRAKRRDHATRQLQASPQRQIGSAHDAVRAHWFRDIPDSFALEPAANVRRNADQLPALGRRGPLGQLVCGDARNARQLFGVPGPRYTWQRAADRHATRKRRLRVAQRAVCVRYLATGRRVHAQLRVELRHRNTGA